MKTKSLRLLVFSFALCALTFALLSGCQNQHLYRDTRILMGTFVEVTSPHKEAAGIVFSEIERIEGLLSKYKEGSDVYRLNQAGRLQVSPETFYIIKKAKEFYVLSAGAFDITVAGIMHLWGFSEKKFNLPEGPKIKQALKFIGSDKIVLQDKDNVIKFKLSGMKIDLGGIAKGFAVDCAINELKRKGIKSCLINAGGQIYALGDKFGKPWRIAIRSDRGSSFSGYLELKDKAVSTSGDYEQYFIQGKDRYSHIMDPRTGHPAESKVNSVTVVAPDGLTADALSTAIFVLGKNEGEKLAGKFKNTYFIIGDGSQTKAKPVPKEGQVSD